MSFHSPYRTTASATYFTEDQFAMKRHMTDAIAIYDNGYDDLRDSALEAIIEGRSAYWTTSSYSAARTIDMPLALNRGVPMDDVLTETFPKWCADLRLRALDTLVPLNAKAVNSLGLAYARCGSFRDDYELERRRLRDMRPSVKRELLTYANYLKSKEAI